MGARHPETGAGGEGGEQRGQPPGLDFGVAVEEQEQIGTRRGEATVGTGSESHGGVVAQHPHLGMAGRDGGRGVVAARVVDQDHFDGLGPGPNGGGQAGEAGEGQVAGVAAGDDDGEGDGHGRVGPRGGKPGP